MSSNDKSIPTHQSFEMTGPSHHPTPYMTPRTSFTVNASRASSVLAQVRRHNDEVNMETKGGYLLPPQTYTPHQSHEHLVHWSDRPRTPSTRGDINEMV